MADDQMELDEYFMDVAVLTARLSKDPKLKVGACLVENNTVISTGYNTPPPGGDILFIPEKKQDKNKYIIHAALNAITNCPYKIEKGVLYVTYHPCNECAKFIVKSGIKKIYFLNEKVGSKFDFPLAREILTSFGVDIQRFEPRYKEVITYKYRDMIMGVRACDVDKFN